MKAKYALIALIAVTFFGCDDNTAGLGLGMFPDSDQNINGKLTTFEVTTESVEAGNIYAKTNIGYVGKFTDATFGTYDAGFLATLNCPKGLTFPAPYQKPSSGSKGTGSMVVDFTNVGLDAATISKYHIVKDKDGNAIGNCLINLYLWYSSYFGDSLTACRMSIYELETPLNKADAYYTNINPEMYYNKTKGLLGTKAYTAVDMSVSDSARSLSTYYPKITLTLNKDITETIGGRILSEAKDKGSAFSGYFADVFKGLYVKSDYGDGTVLYIYQAQMDIASLCYAIGEDGAILKSQKYAGKDSIVYSGRTFASTREVIQANHLQNDQTAIDNLIKQEDCTYLKSPAGIFTQATLPVEKIKEDLAGDTLNAVKLTFSNYNQSSDKKFGMSIPSTVMLIRKKYKDSFFEKNQLPDNVTSFLASHTGSTNQYTFSNITKLINDCVTEREAAQKEWNEKGTATVRDEKGDPMKDSTGKPMTASTMKEWENLSGWNEVILIPVLVTTDSSSSSSGGSNIIGVQHDLKPGYVKLKGGRGGDASNPDNKYNLKLEVVSTSFSK